MSNVVDSLAHLLSDTSLVNGVVLFFGILFVVAKGVRRPRGDGILGKTATVTALFEGVTVGAAVVLLFGVLLSFSDKLDIISFWRNNNFIIIIISMTSIIRAVEALFDRPER